MPGLLPYGKAGTRPLGLPHPLGRALAPKGPELEILAACPLHWVLPARVTHARPLADGQQLMRTRRDVPSRLSAPSSSPASPGCRLYFLPICLCPTEITGLAAECQGRGCGDVVSKKSKGICLDACVRTHVFARIYCVHECKCLHASCAYVCT